jgi:DNA-binding MarR family transcriptional regulator
VSFKAQAWAEQVTDPISTVEAYILDILAYKADEQRFECYPSMQFLARRVRVHRSTVYRALHELETRGLITKVKRGHSQGRANTYRVNVGSATRLPAEVAEERPEHLAPAGEIGQGMLHSATNGYPQGVASDATGDVAQCDKPARGDVAQCDRGVASDATGGVASDATTTINEQSRTITDDAPVVFVTETGRGLVVKLDEETQQIGRTHIAQIRSQLAASRSGSDGPGAL